MAIKKVFGAILILSIQFIVGCTSVAHIEDLPNSFEAVDFDGQQMNERGFFEHTFEVYKVMDDEFYVAVREALTTNGFEIVKIDRESRVLTAKRGIRANEWGSVVGVYSNRDADKLKVKVIVKVAQDITGAFPKNYAENISNRITKMLNKK